MFGFRSSRRGWFRAIAGALSGLVVGAPWVRSPRGHTIACNKSVPRRTVFYFDPLTLKTHRSVMTFFCDGSGKIAHIRDEPGTTTTYVYDADGNEFLT